MKKILLSFLMLLFSVASNADEKLKPFIYAYTATGDVASLEQQLAKQLRVGGFDVVGKYVPFEGTTIIAITNDVLLSNAAASEFGGYGAVQRIALVKKDDGIQVSYTNPTYMAHAYRMNSDLNGVTQQLGKIIGNEHQFGPKNGLTPKELRSYHYMFGMEYFDDTDEHLIFEADSYQQAVDNIEANLANKVAGVGKVYRVDLPGKDETVFGVSLNAPNDSARAMDDAYIMSEIDFKDERSAAHLPYEILVSGSDVYSLYARFRIAINFPDLSMVGSNSFMNIMSTPDAIKDALTIVAGGKVPVAPTFSTTGGN